MKSLTILLAVLLPLLSSGCSFFPSKTMDMLDEAAPNVPVVMLDGKKETLGKYYGKTIVLAFWESTCPYSRPEIRELNEYAEKFSHREDVAFLAVSIDPKKREERLINMAKSEEYNDIEHFFSGTAAYDTAYSSFYLDAVPAFVVIDTKGKIRAISRDAAVVEDFIQN